MEPHRDGTPSGWTLKRSAGLEEMADRRTPFAATHANPELARLADGRRWRTPIHPQVWTLPAGAFGAGGGPS